MDRDRDTQARPTNRHDRNRSQEPEHSAEKAPEQPAEQPAEQQSAEEAPGSGPEASRAPEPGADRATPPGEPSAPSQPEDVQPVKRRTGDHRRVTGELVEEERRVAARRQRDRESRERRHHVIQRVTLGVDYVFYLLYGLLGIRFILSLLGAAETAGFVVFIHGMTNPFYAPFSGIVARPAINGGVLDFPLVIAVLAYALLHLAMRGLLRLLAGDRNVP